MMWIIKSFIYHFKKQSHKLFRFSSVFGCQGWRRHVEKCCAAFSCNCFCKHRFSSSFSIEVRFLSIIIHQNASKYMEIETKDRYSYLVDRPSRHLSKDAVFLWKSQASTLVIPQLLQVDAWPHANQQYHPIAYQDSFEQYLVLRDQPDHCRKWILQTFFLPLDPHFHLLHLHSVCIWLNIEIL